MLLNTFIRYFRIIIYYYTGWNLNHKLPIFLANFMPRRISYLYLIILYQFKVNFGIYIFDNVDILTIFVIFLDVLLRNC